MQYLEGCPFSYQMTIKTLISNACDVVSGCITVESRKFKSYGLRILFRSILSSNYSISMHGSRGGGQGVRTSIPEKSQNIGFLCNTGLGPLKLPSELSMLGHHRPANETPFNGYIWKMLNFSIWILTPRPHTNFKTNRCQSYTLSDKIFKLILHENQLELVSKS